ncbi:hypothetical protein BFP70_04895 [Thioclava sp. SK-1]|uniref:M23 family metallopeptidase n=1 Tax=Thioclava sp. SK-1 TaxID=1889770 RepID=UPI00082526F0|nr:M23 family metallopeptidase [Thioclava sp. SK-1]OCX66560.1 hypothetical protein BFP70_04895 [Thioclava sp. SK-1]
MTFEIDPAFRNSGAQAKKRRQARRAKLFAWGMGGIMLCAVAIGWGALNAPPNASDNLTMVQTQTTAPEPPPRSAFVDLARDPMILHFDTQAQDHVIRFAGPDGLAIERVGPVGPQRLSLLRDDLFVAEKRLMTTLPSSRDDFALFQASRSQALDQGTPAPPNRVQAGPGTVVSVGDGDGDGGSWGAFIAADAHPQDTQAQPATYIETQIENTTSVALTLRDTQRLALFEDVIVVLNAPRALDEVLRSNGFDEGRARQITQAALRELQLPVQLQSGSIVALRVKPTAQGPRLLQMSLYGPDGYLATLAQIGAGRYSRAADPWLKEDLLARSGGLRQAAMAPQDIRLLDALYSAAIRNGLPTDLVGELIVVMSQRFDLERFVSPEDHVTLLFATAPGPQGAGVGQLLFAGIAGPSGQMPCYVVPMTQGGGYSCFNFDAPNAGPAASGVIGGGLLVPVNGVKTSGFGPRHHPILRQVRDHDGVDWAAPSGTPVHAVADGIVKVAGNGGSYGNVIYIDHDDGVQSRYAHLQGFAPGITAGQPVTAGQEIGKVGTTGRSTGPHLHFELRVSGVAVDPMSYGGTAVAGGGGAVPALVNRIIHVESAGKADAKNTRSSATGLGQFIDSTWLRMMRSYRPDLVATLDRTQLLALRTDAALSREMVRHLARENESYLRARDHRVTPGRLYLAHFLGPAGADLALRAPGDSSVLSVLGPAVVGANPFLRGKTIAQLRSWADRKMQGAGASAPMRQVVVPASVLAYRTAIDLALKEAG